MELSNGLAKEVTFIVGTREIIIPLSDFEKNGIHAQDLIAEADTLSPAIIIPLANVSYSAFKKIQRFLYNPEEKQAILSSLKEVQDINNVSVACPPLEVICHGFIYCHLCPDSALSILANRERLLSEDSQRFLVKIAKDFVNYAPLSTLESDACLKMYPDDLKRCLDSFRDEPYKLFVMLMRRAKHEGAKHGVPVRSAITEYLPKINFLSMTPKEFMAGPAESDILTDAEKFSILANIHNPGSVQLPEWCSTRRKRRGEEIFCLYTCKYSNNFSDMVKSPFVSVVSFNPEDRDVVLVGIDFHSYHVFRTNSYIPAVLKITSGTHGSKIETIVPFPPKSTYLQVPGRVIVSKGTTCHVTVTVNEPGLELFSCGRTNMTQSKVRVAQGNFSCSCNLSSGAAHIKKLYLHKC